MYENVSLQNGGMYEKVLLQNGGMYENVWTHGGCCDRRLKKTKNEKTFNL
jgi:hypothetical protein